MAAFTSLLLNWYYSRTRPMPWRGQKDPYKIWLSEVMLQQTQVDTVIPYYSTWLKRFPTIEAVAKASEDQILKAWEGLGYYARARNFHRACQQLAAEYQGRLPRDEAVFSKIKGVGPYTLAAVFSIAFQKPIPAIDGNVKRVVSRLRQIPKRASEALPEIEDFLKRHISKKSPGDFNQAMMDLGATICKSKQPLCSGCPVTRVCGAFQAKEVDCYPVPEKRLHRPHYKIAVGIVWKKNKILISKRKAEGLLGGLWEFPGGKIKKHERPRDCVKREIKEEVGMDVKVCGSVGVVRHAFTHFSIEMEGFLCRAIRGRGRAMGCEAFRWVSLNELDRYAFPKSNHKLFPLMLRRLGESR